MLRLPAVGALFAVRDGNSLAAQARGADRLLGGALFTAAGILLRGPSLCSSGFGSPVRAAAVPAVLHTFGIFHALAAGQDILRVTHLAWPGRAQ